ncbi:MAG TPA: family 10 glycosylhydrolase, partial [Longimicrobiales bacterium]|nr:family 10 glycosylhydrolase [Longimicrobiales bacterium]
LVVVAPPEPPGPTTRVEARALWLTRWDWSDAAGIRALMAGAAHARFNVVYFQVRARADAYYRSSLEPWSASLTGTLGTDPGWDPLAVALEEGARHGIQVHAWLNSLIGWCGSTPPPDSDPPHAFVEHPDWVMVDQAGQPMPYDAGCRWLTPGQPGVRTRLAAVAADIARHYAVDGVHLDFIRYPDPSWSWDAASLASWEAARGDEPSLTFEEHRRRLVTRAVRETRDSLLAARPQARLSAAVWGIYRNERGWSGVSTGYDDRLQDARAWVAEGLVDVLAPMVYWTIKPGYGDRLDFAYLADEHAAAVDTRHVYVGLTAEHIDFAELARQIERSRVAGAEGVAVLSARLLHERGWWEALRQGPFRDDAVVPAMPWRGEGSLAREGTRR